MLIVCQSTNDCNYWRKQDWGISHLSVLYPSLLQSKCNKMNSRNKRMSIFLSNNCLTVWSGDVEEWWRLVKKLILSLIAFWHTLLKTRLVYLELKSILFKFQNCFFVSLSNNLLKCNLFYHLINILVVLTSVNFELLLEKNHLDNHKINIVLVQKYCLLNVCLFFVKEVLFYINVFHCILIELIYILINM